MVQEPRPLFAMHVTLNTRPFLSLWPRHYLQWVPPPLPLPHSLPIALFGTLDCLDFSVPSNWACQYICDFVGSSVLLPELVLTQSLVVPYNPSAHSPANSTNLHGHSWLIHRWTGDEQYYCAFWSVSFCCLFTKWIQAGLSWPIIFTWAQQFLLLVNQTLSTYCSGVAKETPCFARHYIRDSW